MTVLVTTETELPAGCLESLQKKGETLLARGARQTDELSILIVDDRRMTDLNRDYRGKDRPTNVLSFPMLDEEEDEGSDLPRLLGDIIISLETARREATATGTALDDYLTILLVHGFVHLLGFDHEAGEEEAGRMLMMEQKLLGQLVASPAAKPLGA